MLATLRDGLDLPADPLATTVHGQTVRRAADFAKPAPVDLATLKVAMTPDFGFAPTERLIRATFAEKCALFSKLFLAADEATPDCSGTDEVFEVLRSISFLASFHERYKSTPDMLGPNVRANVEEGLRYTSLDITAALKHQTVLYRRWQSFFERYDVILAPSVCLSPRPWSELFPKEIDGQATRTYFHWLANAYAGHDRHPAVSLPVGLDRNGMPFGLQIVGPRGGDAKVLAVAAALEAQLKGTRAPPAPCPTLRN